jgi:hypothetical protein
VRYGVSSRRFFLGTFSRFQELRRYFRYGAMLAVHLISGAMFRLEWRLPICSRAQAGKGGEAHPGKGSSLVGWKVVAVVAQR